MQLSGFESHDVLVTALFIENINDIFDVLNSRSRFAPGFKKAITVENFQARQPLFENLRQMFASLECRWKVRNPGQKVYEEKTGKILESPRRTGFLGLANCTYVIENLVVYMRKFPLSMVQHLRTYKLNQVCVYKIFSLL